MREEPMKARRSSRSSCAFFLIVFLGMFLPLAVLSGEKKNKPKGDEMPKSVMATLKARFPKAQIVKWGREKEGGIVVYDIEFEQEGRKFEADVGEDGGIHNWEREIPAEDLPEAVMKTVQRQYPGFEPREVMEVTGVKKGKDELEGYEVVLETADEKTIEIMVTPEGAIVEEDEGDEDS
jgi:hypothetical protein